MPYKDPKTSNGKAKTQKRVGAYVNAIRHWTRMYKLSRGCIDCGYNKNGFALQYDHVRGEKLFNVGSGSTWDAVQEEIAKCEIRCANCHSIRTLSGRPVSDLKKDQKFITLMFPSDGLLF